MGLAQEIATRAYQRPRATVQVDGRAIPAIESVAIDYGYDQETASATVAFRGAVPAWLDFRQLVQIWLGYGAYVQVCFTGLVQDVNRTYGPDRYEIRCTGVLGATLLQGPDDRSWSSVLDTTLVGDLLTRSGVTFDAGQIAGDDLTLAVRKAVTLSEKQASTELIQRLDEAQGYRTFDLPDGTVRRQLVLTLPSATGALRFVEGLNDPDAAEPTHYLLEIGNPQTIRGVHTKVVVTGLPSDDGTVPRAAFAGSSVYAPVQQVYEASSDLLETDDACATLAARLLGDHNRVITEVTIRVAGNPYLRPGMTIQVTAPSVGIALGTPFFVVHVRHAYGPGDGFVSEARLYGGASGSGYRTELRPVAAFTYSVTDETFADTGGTPTHYLTVVCDASTSSDPDTPFSALTFAWSATGGDPSTGTGVRFAFKVPATALATTPVEVTLTVSDGTSEDVLTQVVTATGAPVAARELFVAAGSHFLATPDGGATWHRYPAAGAFVNTVRAVAPLLPTGEGYFGAGTQLYRTLDYCATAPTAIHAFDGAVASLWLHESIANRMLVGLDTGKVYLTTNLDAGTGATWRQLPHVFASPVLAVAESFDALGLIRVSSGASLWISHDALGSALQGVSFATTARQIALGFAGNYVAGTGAPYAQEELGGVLTFPSLSPAVSDVRAVTTHIRDAVVYCADRSGRTFYTDSGGASLTRGGDLGAGDAANQLLRDGDHQELIYAAADDGVYKSFDGARSWWLMRALTGAGEVGYQIGYGGATLDQAEQVIVETTTADKACAMIVPGDWHFADFDDSAYPNAVLQTSGQGYGFADYGTPQPPFVRPGAWANGLRRRFTLGSGRIVGATIEIHAWNQLFSFGVNGHVTTFGGPDWTGLDGQIERVYTGTLPPEWLIPGAENVISLHVANGSATYTGAPPGYPPGNDFHMGARYRLVIN